MSKFSKLIIIGLLLFTLLSSTSCSQRTTKSTRIATHISFSASPTVLDPAKGRYAHLGGSLIGNQRRIAGVPIILEQRTGGVWSRLTTVTTDRNGVYFYRFPPSTSAVYRARFAGNATYLPCTSASARIDIAVQ